MIHGIFVANQGPVIPLTLRDTEGFEWKFNAVVDTGFNNWLTLPKHLIESLRLNYNEQTFAILADGQAKPLANYNATVVWNGQPMTITVEQLESEPLVGLRLLHGFRFTMEATESGAVHIEHL